MIISEFFKENDMTLSSKGLSAMGKAIKDIYPNMSMWIAHDEDEEYLAKKIIAIELPEVDCIKILNLTVKYAGLWAFS